MNTFETLVKWLHACCPEGMTPQLGVADADKTALIWLPGKTAKPSGATIDGDRARFLGCTNRCYRSAHEAMDTQPSALTHVGLDIDFEDQTAPITTPNHLIAAVSEAITDDTGLAGSLRSSCGGKGLHVFFRLKSPVSLPPHPVRGLHTAITRHLVAPYKKAIEEAGVHVCKDDSRMFWLWGGKNEWLMTTERTIPVASGLVSRIVPGPIGGDRATMPGNRGWPKWVDGDPFVRDWLERLQVRPGLVYVGTVVERLRSLGERVETRSRCSGDGKPNGYIDVAPGRVSLWTYADGATIWADEDVERLVGSFGVKED